MSSDLDFRDRARAFGALDGTTYDVVVIGAGITGAGIARDAAQRGLRVALVEARDVASGTSSRSSKLVHGGLRYLAHGDVSLVREAASERQILREIAPHLARLCTVVLPVRSRRRAALLRSALWTYEKLGHVPKAEKHESWSARELAEREPLAAVDGVVGAVAYAEFLTNDARLTLANVRSARAAGADVLTYAAVTEILLEGGAAVGVRCRSSLPNERHAASVRGAVIVNAAGPWVDAVRALETGGAAPRLAITKGIHIVVPHRRLPIQRAIFMEAADKRPTFAIPSGEITYLGTTDTFYSGTDYWPDIERADIDYLFETAQRTFATEPLRDDDVVAMWSGLRPLIAQAGKKPSEISRKDEVWTGPGGVLSVAGGKLTAYRTMAERAVDLVVERLGRTARPCTTATAPLVGGESTERTSSERLAALYGSEARAVVADGGDVAAEVRHAVLREGALTLEDYWVRRSARAWFSADAGATSLAPAAAEMARLLGWDEATTQTHIDACRRANGKDCS